jgi:hypothetical protein
MVRLYHITKADIYSLLHLRVESVLFYLRTHPYKVDTGVFFIVLLIEENKIRSDLSRYIVTVTI